jgi:hypothetical protein
MHSTHRPDKEIIKFKGINKDVLPHIQDLEDLLYINTSKELNQEKWFKKVIEGNITVSEVAYTLKVTSNKRQAVYLDNIFNSTVLKHPFYYDKIKNKLLVINDPLILIPLKVGSPVLYVSSLNKGLRKKDC